MPVTIEQEAVIMQMIDDDANEEMSGIEPMSDDELVNFCTNQISEGFGGTGEENQDISRPLDYYFGRQPGLTKTKAKDPQASTYVSMDVQDGVEATVAEVMPTFTTDLIAFYEPGSEKDEDQARQETELVNYLFFEEYDGYTLLQVAIKDALLHRNCTVKAYWDERQVVEYETFDDVPEMGLQAVLQPKEEGEQVEVVEQYITEEGDPTKADQIANLSLADPASASMAMQSPESVAEVQQAALMAQDKYTIKVKRTRVVGKPKIESVPPENVIVNENHDSPYLQDCVFVAHENIETESSLIEQGYDPDIVKGLPTYDGGIDDISRRRSEDNQSYDSSHHSVRYIQVYECYPLVDFDGDGIAERRRVVISGNELLANDEWKSVPMIGGCAMVVPHKYQGISLYDRLKSIQDAKTPVARAIIEGTQLSANPRTGVVTGEVNLDDMLTSRTGGVVRAKNVNSVFELPNPQIPQSSYGMLQYMDSVRAERGGSAIDTASQAMSVSGDTAHGIERTMSAIEQTNAMIARSIGETLIRGIFIQIHCILRENYTGDLTARVGGKWMTSIPKDWKNRTNVSVQIGSSHAERARQAGVLKEAIGLQAQLAQQGSVMFSESKAYTTITRAMSLSGIKNPEDHFVDPASPEGKKAKAQKNQQQQMMAEQRKQAEAMMADAQQKLSQAEEMKGRAAIMSQQAKLITERMKMKNDQLKNQNQQFADGVKTAMEQEKLDRQTAMDLLKLEIDAGQDLNYAYTDNLEEVR